MSDAQRIEQIVAEVVRRLSELSTASAVPAPAAAAASNPAAPKPAAPKPAAPALPSDTLVLDVRVISTDTIRGRLQGIRTLVVPRRTVVTPSARDELHKRHVRLEHQAAPATTDQPAELTVVRYTHAADAARACATLPLPSGASEQLRDDLAAAVSVANEAVRCSHRVAVLVTDQTLAAVCLLNRAPHVRAAVARHVDDVPRAIAAIGVNVLIVDPRLMRANQWNVALQVFLQDLPRRVTLS